MEYKGQTLGLKINEKKTKYMRLSAVEVRRRVQSITIGQYSFEGVKDFVYLGSSLNNSNNISEEIKRRIMAGNRVYLANIKLLKSKLLSKTTKMKLYKTLIKPVVCYGAETWTKADSNRLKIFERKIYGALNEVRWRIRSNNEIEQILENKNIVKFIKPCRVERMDEEIIPKRVILAKMEGTRRQGRPRSTWIDEVKKDLQQMGIWNWRSVAKDRDEWRRIVLEAKGHYGL